MLGIATRIIINPSILTSPYFYDLNPSKQWLKNFSNQPLMYLLIVIIPSIIYICWHFMFTGLLAKWNQFSIVYLPMLLRSICDTSFSASWTLSTIKVCMLESKMSTSKLERLTIIHIPKTVTIDSVYNFFKTHFSLWKQVLIFHVRGKNF